MTSLKENFSLLLLTVLVIIAEIFVIRLAGGASWAVALFTIWAWVMLEKLVEEILK